MIDISTDHRRMASPEHQPPRYRRFASGINRPGKRHKLMIQVSLTMLALTMALVTVAHIAERYSSS